MDPNVDQLEHSMASLVDGTSPVQSECPPKIPSQTKAHAHVRGLII